MPVGWQDAGLSRPSGVRAKRINQRVEYHGVGVSDNIIARAFPIL
jgi:hypothetical protein